MLYDLGPDGIRKINNTSEYCDTIEVFPFYYYNGNYWEIDDSIEYFSELDIAIGTSQSTSFMYKIFYGNDIYNITSKTTYYLYHAGYSTVPISGENYTTECFSDVNTAKLADGLYFKLNPINEYNRTGIKLTSNWINSNKLSGVFMVPNGTNIKTLTPIRVIDSSDFIWNAIDEITHYSDYCELTFDFHMLTTSTTFHPNFYDLSLIGNTMKCRAIEEDGNSYRLIDENENQNELIAVQLVGFVDGVWQLPNDNPITDDQSPYHDAGYYKPYLFLLKTDTIL